jgi:hypothetical protein
MMWDDDEEVVRLADQGPLDPALWATEVIHYVTAVYTIDELQLSLFSSSAVVIITQSPSHAPNSVEPLPPAT